MAAKVAVLSIGFALRNALCAGVSGRRPSERKQRALERYQLRERLHWQKKITKLSLSLVCCFQTLIKLDLLLLI